MAENLTDNIGSFEEFYAIKIAPLVNEYRRKNKSSNRAGMLALLLPFGAAGVFIAYINYDNFEAGFFLSFLLLIISIYAIYSYTRKEADFNDTFKEKVIREIAAYIIPGIRYEPMKYINSKLYKASALYRRICKHIDGDDLVTGSYKNVPFQASELSSYFHHDDSHRPIFKGIFFVAETGRFEGGTYIWPKDDVQLPVSIADEHYRLYPLPTIYKINTGTPLFDRYYSVYSTYPAEAHVILSEDIMQRMINLRKQLKKEIRFSYVAGRFYAAIEHRHQILEPINDLSDKEAVKEYFFTILLYPAIINQLKLYEYI